MCLNSIVFRKLWRQNLFLAAEHPPDFQCVDWKANRIASLLFNNNNNNNNNL